MIIKLPGGVVLTERDQALGLLVCVLALTVALIGAAIVLLTSATWAMEIILMAVAWWFGATMVWLGEKYYQRFKR